MSIKTNSSETILVIATLIASITVFIASLFFPAFNLSNGDSYNGLLTILIGWLGLLVIGDEGYGGIAFFAWFANIFLVLAWLGLASSELRSATVRNLALTIFGLALASIAVFVESIPMDGGSADVTSMGLGFYLWLSSFAICIIGYVLLARTKSISKKYDKSMINEHNY